ncbi:MAG: hypothetical protein ACREPF_10595 [Rhodanobacteraceae bacterium]
MEVLILSVIPALRAALPPRKSAYQRVGSGRRAAPALFPAAKVRKSMHYPDRMFD